jgi:hypothetical protein
MSFIPEFYPFKFKGYIFNKPCAKTKIPTLSRIKVNMMFVDPCIIVQFLTEKANKMQQCIKILLFPVYTLPDNVQQWHIRQPSTVLCKTRDCLCSFRLLMMGGVAPETCWASFKIENNKILIHYSILLAFSVR